jgi:hypothetical protein
MRATRILAVAATLMLFGSAHAATVKALSIGELADRAELIFIGTVAAQHSRLERAPTRVFTDTLFDVQQVMKGDKPEGGFALSQLGGEAGDEAGPVRQTVPGYARFEQGERVLLFLERTTEGRFVVVGLAQGKYVLKTDAKSGRTLALRDLDGLHVLGRLAGERTVLGAPKDPNRVPLEQLVRIIHRARLAPARVIRRAATPQVSIPTEVAR